MSYTTNKALSNAKENKYILSTLWNEGQVFTDRGSSFLSWSCNSKKRSICNRSP